MPDEIRTLEDMDMPCPYGNCDGSGEVMTDDGMQYCLCRTDAEMKEVY